MRYWHDIDHMCTQYVIWFKAKNRSNKILKESWYSFLHNKMKCKNSERNLRFRFRENTRYSTTSPVYVRAKTIKMKTNLREKCNGVESLGIEIFIQHKTPENSNVEVVLRGLYFIFITRLLIWLEKLQISQMREGPRPS